MQLSIIKREKKNKWEKKYVRSKWYKFKIKKILWNLNINLNVNEWKKKIYINIS